MWATSVASARSWSLAATLSTRHGRVLATMPRSANQTLPRFATGIGHLTCVELAKQLVGRLDQLVDETETHKIV